MAGTVYFNGPVTLEAAVLKYKSGAKIVLNSTITCKTSSYRPAIFTGLDDESVGESLWGRDPDWTGTINPAGYADPAIWSHWHSAPSLSNVRICYAQEAIRLEGGTVSATLAHGQIVKCIRGIVLASAQTGSGGSGSSGLSVSVNNSLFAFVTSALIHAPSYGSGSGSGAVPYAYLYHCTVANSQTLAYGATYAPTFVVSFKNSVLANIGALGNASLGNSSYNGFSVAPVFGPAASRWATTDPFQVAEGGAYYLKADSVFRGKGTTGGLPSTLLPALKTKSTQPAVTIPDYTVIGVTEDLRLDRQDAVPRYVTGAPDLGYYYDALDYTVGGVLISGRLTIAPGTAIGVRGGWVGFVSAENSTIISHGTPAKPITYANVCAVQEGPFDYAGIVAFGPTFSLSLDADPYLDRSPTLSFRFSNFYSLAGDFVVASGSSGAWGPSWISSMDLSLQDCKLYGGRLIMGPTKHAALSGAQSSVSFINSSFERVFNAIWPQLNTFWNVDISFQAYNNLFYDGSFVISPSLNSRGSWVVKDNIFDNVAFNQDLTLPWLLDYDYNAYTCHNPCLTGLAQGWTTHLISDLNNPNAYAPHEVTLPANQSYQTGVFGGYYLPDSPQRHNAGSRTRAEAGFSQYTTRLDQFKDGPQARVNIGVHYVAASVSSGQPLDSDSDGVPNYVADADGNGLVDANDPALPPTPLSPWTRAHNDIFPVLTATPTELAVLANDTDSDGRSFTVFFPWPAFNTPHGAVAPTADFRGLVYTPAGGFSGVDTFTYAAVNDFSRETSARVTVFVNEPGNQAPVAADDAAIMGADDVTIPIYVLNNDTDPNGHPLSIYSVGAPQLGSVVNLGSRLEYTRPTTIGGEDTFTYVVTDGHFGIAVGTVRVNRDIGANHPPIATSYSTTAVSGQPINLILPATDPDNDTLTYSVVANPQHGTLTAGSQPATRIYTPQTDYTGPDFLTFAASDGTLEATASISIGVQRGNNPPVALGDYATAVLNEPLTKLFSGYDWDWDYLTYRITTPPTHGLVAVQENGSAFTYTPVSDYIGDDMFGFVANDGKEDSAEAWVQVSVTPLKIVTLTGTITDSYTLKGNTTYYVPSVVTFNGSVTIEGGAVVKFAYHNPAGPGSKLVFNGSVQCETSPYRPAIFTAEDDDTVGATLETSRHEIYGWNYAEVALELRATGGTELKHIRVSFARTAIHYPMNSGPASDTVRHIQIVDCEKLS